MKKILKKVVIITTAVMLMTGSVWATPITEVNVTLNHNVLLLEESGQSARIDWNQSSIEVIGMGAPPENVGVAQGRILARRAAIVDAYRNLTETIQGVQIDSNTTMQNIIISSDIVKAKVAGIVKGARILRELPQIDGSYQVVMSINMYGPNGVAAVALSAVRPPQIVEFIKPVQIKPVVTVVTGVIVDARNLGLEPTFSPKICDESGRVVYSNIYINVVPSQGLVEYAMTPQMFNAAIEGQSRAGASPLTVKAIAVSDNNCNLVISKTDAEIILSYNSNCEILKKCAVVFAP